MPPVDPNFYRGTLAAALPGMLANMEPKTIISRTNEDDALLPFGRAVFQGAEDMGVTATPAADKFVGITVIDRAAFASPDLETEGFRKGDNCRILRRGVVWVVAAEAVAPRAPVFVTPAGAFTSAASGNIAVPGATFDTTTTEAGELAKVRIDQ